MKISRHADGSKATEIGVDENGNTVMNLQGDTPIKAIHRDTGSISDVANITHTGEMDFTRRPSVGGVDVALATDGEGSLETEYRTIVDNSTTVITLCPVQHSVTVLYRVQNAGTNESGTITIIKTANGFDASTEQRAEDGYFSDIEFTASESNGSLLLNVVGSGAGLITDFYYRVNSINTLYL